MSMDKYYNKKEVDATINRLIEECKQVGAEVETIFVLNTVKLVLDEAITTVTIDWGEADERGVSH